MYLDLTEKNPTTLLNTLQQSLAVAAPHVTIELLGPGSILHDTALMLFEELKRRTARTHIHIHTRTCLFDGAILLWLAGDTRSMRDDSWIQISDIPKPPGTESFSLRPPSDYSTAICTTEENPCETDLRTVMNYLKGWLPVDEVAGLRLFEPDIRALGLIEDAASQEHVSALFKPGKTPPTRTGWPRIG